MTNRDDKKKEFKKLMKEIARNPEKGLRQFYDIYAPIITTTAKIICRSADKTNEVVNDVLFKIWKSSKTVGVIDNPEGWIYVITANTAKDAMRERYVFQLDENIASNDDKIQEVIDKHSFYGMIEELSEIEQRIMIYKFVSLYTFQKIADELEKPLTTITSIYYRALEKIKKNI